VIACTRAHHDLAHVRNIEKSCRGTRVLMLAQDAERIVNGHGPAGEGFDARTVRDVPGMQGKMGWTCIHGGDSFGSPLAASKFIAPSVASA
jgi:hypothetical protein